MLLLQLLRLCKGGFVVCVFIPSPSTHSPHSWRSSLAHVDECRFYLETWPLVTIQSHVIKQRLLTFLWRATFSVQYSPAKRSAFPFLPPPCTKHSVCRLLEWKFFFLMLENFMVVAEDLRAVRMAEDGSVDSDLPDCNCDITRQAAIFVCFWLIRFFLKSWLAGKLIEILTRRNHYLSYKLLFSTQFKNSWQW